MALRVLFGGRGNVEFRCEGFAPSPLVQEDLRISCPLHQLDVQVSFVCIADRVNMEGILSNHIRLQGTSRFLRKSQVTRANEIKTTNEIATAYFSNTLFLVNPPSSHISSVPSV
jgi:hypothetical protein